MAVLWITAADLADPDDPMAPIIAEAVSFALFKLSGEKYPGVQEVTEWYGNRNTSCWSCSSLDLYTDGSGNIVYPHGHRFYDGSPPGLKTRGRPIISVSSIVSAGGPLASADYKVANRSVIYRNGGCWDFSGGVTVTYSYGMYPPALGRLAAIKLGNEFLLSVNDDDECSLPDRVTSVTRLGLSFSLSDPAALAALGRTGLYEVDLFLSTVNPARALLKPRVFTADAPRGERYL